MDSFGLFVCLLFLFIHFKIWMALVEISDTLEKIAKQSGEKDV